MKVITVSLLMLAIALASFAQTPGGPVGPAAQPQSTAPAEPAKPPAAAPATPAEPAPAGDDSRIIVPAETTIPIMLLTPINTKSAFVGASVYCESVYPITVGNRIVIPRGSSVRGTITQIVRPGHVKGRAQIGLRFDELVLPNGTTVELRAVLSGFGSSSGEKFKPDEGRIEGESSKGQDIGKIATTTVEGAGMGTLIGGLSNGGHAGEGAGIGAGAGALAGVIWVLASRGKDAVLPHGTNLELKLTRPIDFSRWEIQPRSPYDEGPAMPRREYGPRN